MEPLPNNTRYILELERNRLLDQKHGVDQKYGMFSFIFLASLENLALVAYLYIVTILVYHKTTRTKTNVIVGIWALINGVVLAERLLRLFEVFFKFGLGLGEDVDELCQMIAALGRSYGTVLAIVWLFSKYFGTPKPKFNALIYSLMAMPTFICFYFIFYYLYVNRYIYEVYGPGCDIVDLAIYLLVGFVFVSCKIFGTSSKNISQYTILIALVNLITNLPICLMTIYLRFNLDVGWVYRFHIYFVDLFANVINCSNAFVVLFLIIFYRRKSRKENIFLNKHVDDDDDCC